MRAIVRGLMTGLILVLVGASSGESQQKALVVRFVPSAIPADPAWAGWKGAPALAVALGPQAIAPPWALTPSIRQLTVQALHNGTWIAFRLSWKDATKNSVMYTDTFRDAAAIMVPVGKEAAITMGAAGQRALILHWKADWQEDIDKTFQDVAQLYPNAWVDWYPFAPGEPPYDMTAWTNPESRRYLTGWVLGNPRSQPIKRTSVEEQIAEGFGTLTTSERQSAIGKGAYADGGWSVAITRPFVTGDPSDPAWGPGKASVVSFGVWDGAKGEIGSRKGISAWVPLRVAPGRR